MTMKTLALILCILAAASASLGRVWHVGNVNGSDLAGGYLSPSDRLATIAKAVELMSPSDDVWVHNEGAYYTEPLSLTNSGTSWANPVRIKGIGTPVITGGFTPASWAQVGSTYIYSTTCETATYFVVEDDVPLTMIGEHYWLSAGVDALTTLYTSVNSGWGQAEDYYGEAARAPADFTNEMYAGTFSWSNDILYVWCSDSNAPATHTMEVAVRPDVAVISGAYIDITGFEFRLDNRFAFNNWGGVYLRGTGPTRFHGNTVKFSSGMGLALLQGGQWFVESNRFTYNGCVGLGGKGRDTHIIGNVFDYNNWHRHWHGWQCGGMKITAPLDAVVISDNTISNNWGPGIWTDIPYVQDVQIRRNLVHHNWWEGIFVEFGSTVSVANNILAFNWGDGVHAKHVDRAGIYHNTLYKNGGAGVCLNNYAHADPLLGGRPISEWGSTITNWMHGRASLNADAHFPTTDGRIWGNMFVLNRWTNNVMAHETWYSNGLHRGEVEYPRDSYDALSDGTGYDIDCNFYWRDVDQIGSATQYWFEMINTTGVNRAYWTGTLGYDTNSTFHLDPLLTDPENLDFTLATNSPARDTVFHFMGVV